MADDQQATNGQNQGQPAGVSEQSAHSAGGVAKRQNGRASTPSKTEVWEGKDVSIGTIERQLMRLWTVFNKPAKGSDQVTSATRTSVLNLIICTTSAEEAKKTMEITAQLSVKHPSRTLIFLLQPDDPTSSIDATVSAFQVGGSQETIICGEQAVITVHGQSATHLLSVVMPLLTADLPVFLWWAGEILFPQELFSLLEEICDRLILDTCKLTNVEAIVPHLAEALCQKECNCAISDIAWARLVAWRELTARFFDAKDRRPYLDQITSIALEYSGEVGTSSNPSEALLFIAWMATALNWQIIPQLRWKRTAQGSGTIILQRAGTPVTVTIQKLQHPTAKLNELTSVYLVAAGGKDGRSGPASLRLTRDPDSQHVQIEIKGEGVEAIRIANLAAISEADLIGKELQVFDRDRFYEQVLNFVSELLGLEIVEEFHAERSE